MTFYIVSNGPSDGAAALREGFRARGHQVRRVILSNNQSLPPDLDPRRDFVINWGSSDASLIGKNASNSPNAVGIASNKRSFFNTYSRVDGGRLPQYTTNQDTARAWVASGVVVVARTVLSGHSGVGIQILESPLDFVEAPLYTVYMKKAAEYRVHFGNDGIFDVQRKALRIGYENPNHRVRTASNGYVYVRQGVEESVPEDVMVQAQRTVDVTNLKHGAIDIIYNRRNDRAVVLEINTAPGCEGTTVEKYVNMFTAWAAHRA